MRVNRKVLFAASLLATSLGLLVGCGGGGGASSIGGGSGSTANLFITDDLNNGYDGVWVNLHEVKLIDAAGTSIKVFDSDAGVTVNLRALNDGGSRFLFLGRGVVPAGTYGLVEVTMDKALKLFSTGASAGQDAVFASALDHGAGLSQAKIDLASPITFPTSGVDLVLDFDLANWTFDAGVVTPVVRRFNGGGLEDHARHENEDYSGTITGLSGSVPNQAFTLARGAGDSFRVQLDSQTAVFRDSGAGSAALANGQPVEVRGTFDPTSDELKATEVKLEDGSGHHGEPQVKGAVKSFNAAAGSLVVTASQVEGFLPDRATVDVAVTGSTVFFSDRGNTVTRAEFFARLAAQGSGAVVEAEGGTVSGNVLTARKIKFEDEGEAGSEAEAKGIPSNMNLSSHTFTLSLQEWEGFQAIGGMKIPVSALPGAMYEIDGDESTQSQFFAALSGRSRVSVHGTFSDGALTANRLELK
jgi:hypothetical protein